MIDSFLKRLHRVKGDIGLVDLCVIHCSLELPTTRGFVAAGSYRPDAVGLWDIPATPGTSAPSDGRVEWEETDFLKIGEYVEFHGKMPCAGYVHLFNFGTSGKCIKLFPSQEYPDNFEPVGAVFWVPSKKHCGVPFRDFCEVGPATIETGKPERLFAIVTHDNVDLQIEDLHPKMIGDDLFTRCATRGPGFDGKVRVDTAKLFALRLERWEYGLLEMDVTM